MRPSALFLVALATTVGCADTTEPLETTAVDPSSIVSAVMISSNGAAATVQLSWFSNSDTSRPLLVGAGERLIVRASDAPARDLARVDDKYFALIPTTSSTITVALVKPSGELAFDVALPPEFVVRPPVGPVSRSQPFTLDWTAAPGPIALEVDSPCFGSPIRRGVAQDTGSFTFYPGDFGTGVANCTLSIAVTRQSSFKTTTPFSAGGTVRQVRTIRLETTP